MKFTVKGNSIEIEPEEEYDQAFIEMLGMLKDGQDEDVGEVIREGTGCQETPGFGEESKYVVSKLVIQKKSKA